MADTKAVNLKKCAATLASWRAIARLTGEVDEDDFKEREEELRELWEQLGYGRGEDGAGESGCRTCISRVLTLLSIVVLKKRTRARNPLMSDKDMAGAYQSYVETYFGDSHEVAEELFEALKEQLETDEDGQIDLVDGHATGDLGVAEFANTSEAEVDRLLGLSNSLFPFGETGVGDDNGKPRFQPRWHQKVLVLAALKRICRKKKGEDAEPTFLCDDVGLGKTAMIVGTISMVVHIVECQWGNRPLPPLLTGECSGSESENNIRMLTAPCCRDWQDLSRRQGEGSSISAPHRHPSHSIHPSGERDSQVYGEGSLPGDYILEEN